MKELFLPLLTGFTVGCLFSLFRLPIPAPSALAGILGIVGIYIGFVIVNYLR
jgi:XapX domain-containing protein